MEKKYETIQPSNSLFEIQLHYRSKI